MCFINIWVCICFWEVVVIFVEWSVEVDFLLVVIVGYLVGLRCEIGCVGEYLENGGCFDWLNFY